jgi:lipopolysaccharide/colanic/teichoic acid biosynthesis glycosyltransferase
MNATGDRESGLACIGFGPDNRPPWYKKEVSPHHCGDVAYAFLKRIVDVTLCLLSLPIVLPVLAICVLAVRIDSPGPVVFVQHRTGKDGRRFPMLKLRTMVTDAEKLKERYQSLNTLSYPDFKIKQDPRITRVGKWLRRTSLDELPQIFNVLRGEMTLVGPRPTSFCASTYQLWQTARLEVTPGLTGLWQVSGRSELDFDDRSRLDIAYIRHRSIPLDVEIIIRTVGCVFSGRGAN